MIFLVSFSRHISISIQGNRLLSIKLTLEKVGYRITSDWIGFRCGDSCSCRFISWSILLWMTCVLIVHFLKRYTLWEAYFDEYGWITQIRNNHEKPEWQVLEAYAQYNTKYAQYFDRYIQKNPSFSQKSGNHRNGAFLTGYWIGYLIFSLICSVLIYFIKQLYIG